MLGSLKSDVTRKYVVYALARSTSPASRCPCVRRWKIATAEKSPASATRVAASARGCHARKGERATVTTSTENGNRKKRSSIAALSQVAGPEKRDPREGDERRGWDLQAAVGVICRCRLGRREPGGPRLRPRRRRRAAGADKPSAIRSRPRSGKAPPPARRPGLSPDTERVPPRRPRRREVRPRGRRDGSQA